MVDSWIKIYGVRYFSELTNMAVLTEEVGELARIMARKYGDQSFKEGEKHDLGDEMADVLWVLMCLANQTGVDLTEALKKNIEKILNKYDTMGKEIDKIYVQLKQYESEIEANNKKLDAMYDANLGYYQQLVKYIMAGEQGVKELDAFIEQYQAKVAENPDDGTIRMDLSNLQQMREILDQRVMDLKVAENVALQTVPMLKTMEYSNLNLVRKVHSN